MKGRTSIRLALSLAMAASVAQTACARPKGIGEASSAIRTNDLPGARALLEADRDSHPRSAQVRITLGEVYYRLAREALDWEGDEGRYLAYLEKSVDEFVVAARLEPENSRPHFYLATMDVYRGDLQSALRGFLNTRRLGSGPVAETNIAEIYIYMGNLQAATRWNQSGYRAGVGLGPVTFNRMLMRWSEGDLDGARGDFETLRSRHPRMIRSINVALLPTTPEKFEQFAGYCCKSPACGPYLEHACTDLGLEVGRREVSEETLLRELRLEIEKRRRLREIYRQRKELELEVGEEEPAS